MLRAGSIGVLLPGNEARVVDTETGKDKGKNQSGELLVRSLAIMKGIVIKERKGTMIF